MLRDTTTWLAEHKRRVNNGFWSCPSPVDGKLLVRRSHNQLVLHINELMYKSSPYKMRQRILNESKPRRKNP
jgi:hypothetical protein